MIIEDGFGSGAKQEVDKFGRSRVFSTSTTQETHATDLGVAFTYSFGGEISIPNAFDGYVMYVKNNNVGSVLSMSSIVGATDVAGLRMDIYRNPTLGVTANNTAIVGVNNNFSKSSTPQSTAEKWDGVGVGLTGLTVGSVLQSRILGVGADDNPIDGSINIEANNIIAFWINNPTGGAVRLTLSMRGFFKEAGTPKSLFA